ncbi:polyribonucleotide nucleotidyltransferase [Dehalobacterium formicoaceticum]|uniref:Polyribonucleotide nucleotidyltransferase n=1 Tax=Dehalobacterium formicoaceticum TaxID=51515 RepID=A0ABT1Y4V0_9FIRM|nr:polyribonucleotide nucleotidyltransferase [Dehalobacterium formicoaceticum]MCR6545901.1 polyribonucleotide nucleotidyltransferase [Dehalobacterium formicoaceticum]
MLNKNLRKSIEIGGRTLTLETGRMAKQASGAVFTVYGDTMVLAAATGASEPREGIDFFPLTVDYEERLYAVGKIPGGFIKREGRPSEKAILTSRIIDRPIRPLFPKGYRNDVQVVTTVLSVDQDNPPDMTALNGASAALHVSHIPFLGPIGAVIVGRIDGKLIINPTVDEAAKSDMHIAVAGTRDAVNMVEASALEVPEEEILAAIMFGHEEIKRIVDFIEEFRREALALGLAKEKVEFVPPMPSEELEQSVRSVAIDQFTEAVHKCAAEKMIKSDREQYLKAIKSNIIAQFEEEYPEDLKMIAGLADKFEKEVVRRIIAREKIRIDGRQITEVRPIEVEVSVLSRTHGSSLFTRGQTQILNVCTLGAVGDEQILDGLGVEESKRYMHHYNFPPYSVGEARPIRGPGRREIGHGALAERALEPVIPSEDEFPYTIRLVSEAIESNGSTSMGSVCGSTLSLMDAGVPIKAPVAGVAMGLIKDEDHITVLTDIQGMEDALGDMDFKVAGTAEGVTAIQMDIKITGIDQEVLSRALAQAKDGRMHILGKMLEVISESKTELSPYAPRIIKAQIHPDKIREVIGAGGKIIKKIIEETGAKIDIEDDGRIFIASVDGVNGDKALEIIESITKDVEVGRIYDGKVVKIMDFGAFVEIVPGVLDLPGKEGMVHISQLSDKRVEKVTDVVKEGDPIRVKVIGIDNQGRVKLSRKEVIKEETK